MGRNCLFRVIAVFAIVFLVGLSARQSFAAAISKDPYIGAICVDADSGKVLFEDNPDGRGYPASMIKLMDLLIVLEQIKLKALNLDDQVTVTAEAARIGGSQVYLKEHEVFSVEDLLYALMIQSANDAATALALHIAGSKEGFVDMMNDKAKQLGMTNTIFHSVHGLPPSKGQEPDITTPRDMAKMCMELIKYEDTFKYTSATERPFRADAPEPFIMRSHNHLLRQLPGCDGLKTGYYSNAGFSISATATRKGTRALAVVIGSANRKVRDAKAKELLSRGLVELVKLAPPAAPAPTQIAQAAVVSPAATAALPAAVEAVGQQAPLADNAASNHFTFQISKRTVKIVGGVMGGIVLLFFILYLRRPKEKDRFISYRGR